MYTDAKNSIPIGQTHGASWTQQADKKNLFFFKKRLAFFEIHGIINRLDDSACWSSGQDDALSRRKPGFDSRTGHEAVWNSIQLLFYVYHSFINTRKPQRLPPLGFLRRMRKVHHIS